MNINLLMMTSTRWHFDRTDIYYNTLVALRDEIPEWYFFKKVVHIKVSPGQEDKCVEMTEKIKSLGDIDVLVTDGEWKHGDQSHQNEYIKDIYTGVSYLCSGHYGTYTLFLEDDWLIKSQNENSSVTDWIREAAVLLSRKPDLIQVRIPRFNNEFERINKLNHKHGIPATATKVPNEFYFTANDWSNNPFVARTRDLYIALNLMRKFSQAFPNHAEHGFGRAMKFLSIVAEPLAIINPSNCRCFHMGTKIGEEDKLDQPLNSD